MDYNHTEFEFIMDTSCKIYEGTDLETQKKMRIIDLVNPGTMTAYQTWSGDTLFINNSTRRVFDVSPQYFFHAVEIFNEKEKSTHHEYKPTIVIKDKNTNEVHFAIVERFQTIYANNNTSEMSSEDCDCISYGNLGVGFRLYCDNNFTDLIYNKDGERSDELPLTSDNHLNVTINFSPLPYCDIDFGTDREIHPFGKLAFFGNCLYTNVKETNYHITSSKKNILSSLFSKGGKTRPGLPKRQFNFIIDDHCTIEVRDDRTCIVIKNPKLIKSYQVWSKGSRGYNSDRRYISYVGAGELAANAASVNSYLKLLKNEDKSIFKFTPTAYVEYKGEKYFVVISDIEFNSKNPETKFTTSIEPELVLKLKDNLLCSYDKTLCKKPDLNNVKERIYINVDAMKSHGDINHTSLRACLLTYGIYRFACAGRFLDPKVFFNFPRNSMMIRNSNSNPRAIQKQKLKRRNKTANFDNKRFIKGNKFVFNLDKDTSSSLSLVKRHKSAFQIKLKNDNPDITDHDFSDDPNIQPYIDGQYIIDPNFYTASDEYNKFDGAHYKIKVGCRDDNPLANDPDQNLIKVDPNNPLIYWFRANNSNNYVPQPKIRLFIGIEYVFDMSDDSFNQAGQALFDAGSGSTIFDLRFSGNPDGNNSTGGLIGGNPYIPLDDLAVTRTPIRAGNTGSKINFTPGYNDPNNIYYYNYGTPGAGNEINIQPIFTIMNNVPGGGGGDDGDGDGGGGDDDREPETPTDSLAWLGLLGLLAFLPGAAAILRNRRNERDNTDAQTTQNPAFFRNPSQVSTLSDLSDGQGDPADPYNLASPGGPDSSIIAVRQATNGTYDLADPGIQALYDLAGNIFADPPVVYTDRVMTDMATDHDPATYADIFFAAGETQGEGFGDGDGVTPSDASTRTEFASRMMQSVHEGVDGIMGDPESRPSDEAIATVSGSLATAVLVQNSGLEEVDYVTVVTSDLSVVPARSPPAGSQGTASVLLMQGQTEASVVELYETPQTQAIPSTAQGFSIPIDGEEGGVIILYETPADADYIELGDPLSVDTASIPLTLSQARQAADATPSAQHVAQNRDTLRELPGRPPPPDYVDPPDFTDGNVYEEVGDEATGQPVYDDPEPYNGQFLVSGARSLEGSVGSSTVDITFPQTMTLKNGDTFSLQDALISIAQNFKEAGASTETVYGDLADVATPEMFDTFVDIVNTTDLSGISNIGELQAKLIGAFQSKGTQPDIGENYATYICESLGAGLKLANLVNNFDKLEDFLEPSNFSTIADTFSQKTGLDKVELQNNISSAFAEAYSSNPETLLAYMNRTDTRVPMKANGEPVTPGEVFLARFGRILKEKLDRQASDEGVTIDPMEFNGLVKACFSSSGLAFEVRNINLETKAQIDAQLDITIGTTTSSFAKDYNTDHPAEPLTDADIVALKNELIQNIDNIRLDYASQDLLTNFKESPMDYYKDMVNQTIGQTLNTMSQRGDLKMSEDELYALYDAITVEISTEATEREPYEFELGEVALA